MRQKHHRNTHVHVWSLGWSYRCVGCSLPKDHPSGLKLVHVALRSYLLWLMSASPEKRAPSSNSHKGTIWATMAQVVEMHFSHPGNIESKITPIESQAVRFTITFSRHSLLKSSDTSVWSTLIGIFLVIKTGTGNIRHPEEFERTNPQESSEQKPGTGLTAGWSSPLGRPEPAECLDHGHIFMKHSLSALFVVWRTNTRVSTRIKAFIESSQLRSGIGTGLTLRAHRTSDDLCREFTPVLSRASRWWPFLCAHLISWIHRHVMETWEVPVLLSAWLLMPTFQQVLNFSASFFFFLLDAVWTLCNLPNYLNSALT